MTTTFYRSLLALVFGATMIAAPAFASAHTELEAKAMTNDAVTLPAMATGVFIGGNGTVLVRGASVDSVSGSSVSAHSSWGSAVLNWVLPTSSSTEFVGVSTVSDIKVGDTISFSGMLNQSANAFTVTAKVIRDWTNKPATTTHATSTQVHRERGPWFPNPVPVGFWSKLGAHFHFSI